MARKHPVSPNQTVLWTWHSLLPAWGSRALHEPQEKTRKSPRRTTKNSRATEGKTRTQAKKTTPAKITARPSTGRQTSSRDRTQQDTTSKNEQVSAGADGDCRRPSEPGLKNWHFYLGDPIELLLLHPDGRDEPAVLGTDVLTGQRVQVVVPSGTWMGARLCSGGEYGVYGNTMAPGFVPSDFELADSTDPAARWPHRTELIRALTRRPE